MGNCVNRDTAIKWAKLAGFQSLKGTTLFTAVTPEMVQALVDRAVQEALTEAQKVCEHYMSAEPEDMALQCQKHIGTLKTKGLYSATS